jgi:hypothetical protein
MLVIRCKNCNTELTSSPKTQVCGCSNNTTLTDDKISAVDLSKVLIISNNKLDASHDVLTAADLMYQEQRRRRKVKRLDFEVR